MAELKLPQLANFWLDRSRKLAEQQRAPWTVLESGTHRTGN
jgi:hypothetical protein